LKARLGHHPRGTDCGSARKLLLHGAGRAVGRRRLDTGKIETHAAVTLAKTDGGFAITKIALTTTASVPGASKEAFDKAAADAKAGCPISKLFANNTEIVLDAKLV
jgi:lipoyl-dependent peroxiredoxin